MDGADPGVRADERHELDVKRSVDADVRGVLLRTGDAFDPSKSGN